MARICESERRAIEFASAGGIFRVGNGGGAWSGGGLGCWARRLTRSRRLTFGFRLLVDHQLADQDRKADREQAEADSDSSGDLSGALYELAVLVIEPILKGNADRLDAGFSIDSPMRAAELRGDLEECRCQLADAF